MNCYIPSVDYADYLSATLPYNARHFSRVTVVTSPGAPDAEVARRCGASVYETGAFRSGGALFAKYRALEEAMTACGREGWLCLLDADVMLPREADWPLEFGCLHTPLRRYADAFAPEPWDGFRLSGNASVWSGYCHVFHSADPALGQPPWYGTHWRHACGDGQFQLKWPMERKRRFAWTCLHAGETWRNWCGRGNDAAMRELLSGGHGGVEVIS